MADECSVIRLRAEHDSRPFLRILDNKLVQNELTILLVWTCCTQADDDNQASRSSQCRVDAGSYEFTKNLSLEDMKLSGITLDRLEDRKSLLGQLDGLRRAVDANGAIDAADHYTQTAFDVLSPGKLVEALDLSK